MNSFSHSVRTLLRNRFVLLLGYTCILVLLNWYFVGNPLPNPDTANLWFYSGIFMVLFSILFIEPYYSSPKNVMTNAIPLLLVFLSIQSDFTNLVPWIVAVAILAGLLVLSIAVLLLEDKHKSPDHISNRASESLKNFVILVGQGRVLYSASFFYFLFLNYSTQSTYTFILLIVWFSIVSIDPKNIESTFGQARKQIEKNALGRIIGVQSQKIFLVRLFEDRRSVHKFDVVKFKYSMRDSKDMTIFGVVFDMYLLNQEKWIKVLELVGIQDNGPKLEENIVYEVLENDQLVTDLRINDLAGIIVEGSTVGKIKFEYSKKMDDLEEGDLVELSVGDRTLFYQVIDGVTEREIIEARNETSYIVGEAIQLGEWQKDKLSFQKFGWIPTINTPVYKTTAADVEVQDFSYPKFKLGVIPNTNLPCIMDLNDAISHHLALVGVTGSGKSYLARKIIDEIKIDTKVICIDFNKEFIAELSPTPSNMIDASKAEDISRQIDWINAELGKFLNQQDAPKIEATQTLIRNALKQEVESFLNDEIDRVRVFELPDVSNTTGILDYTKYFFKMVFEVAKERQIAGTPVKLCIVLEEAHTIIPEWNFLGSDDKTSKSLVNSIGQIALQGRKYGVGFLVIAQRTANVSKTVLTQCNTVVCFQAFDETSYAFLGNYVGKEMVRVLPNLKQYHAVVAGKALMSNAPMVVNLNNVT